MRQYKGIKLFMDEEEVGKFEEIKKHLGLRHDVEVIRFLINYYHSRELNEKLR